MKKQISPELVSIVSKQIDIATSAEFSILKNISKVLLDPKIRMAQIGGPDIVGKRVSLEPIMDKFENVTYIHSEGRVIKAVKDWIAKEIR